MKVRPTAIVQYSGRITADELKAIGGTLSSGKGHWVRNEMKTLEVGEMMTVHRADWNWKGKGNGPSRIVSHLNRTTNREYRIMRLANGNGWVIERLK